MITLCTGQPGHGKTQWAIRQAIDAAKAGRDVYVGNVKGFKHAETGCKPLDFQHWEECPDGSLIVWDECYDVLPQRAAGRKVPPHIEALARHRHRGFDFILVCQQPMQLDAFVFGLVEEHRHFRRRFMTQAVAIKVWDRAERSPEKAKPLTTKAWRLDRSVWGFYESATQHTGKRSIPWYVIALPLLVVAVLLLGWYVSHRWSGRVEEARAAGAAGGDAVAALPAVPAAKGRSGINPLRQSDPMAYLRPRVPGAPWTAPAYDDVPLGPPPRLACMSSAAKCTCLTVDQGTVWLLDDQLCRLQARYGRYDPTSTSGSGMSSHRPVPSASPAAMQ